MVQVLNVAHVEARWSRGLWAYLRIERSWFVPWPGTLCCVLGQETYSHSALCWGWPCDRLPSRGSRILSTHATETGIISGLNEPLGTYADFTYLFSRISQFFVFSEIPLNPNSIPFHSVPTTTSLGLILHDFLHIFPQDLSNRNLQFDSCQASGHE